MILKPLPTFLSLFESVFFVDTFRALFYLRSSSSRCTHCLHFHFISLFTFVTLINSIEEGHICRPKKNSFLFLYFFLLLLLFYFILFYFILKEQNVKKNKIKLKKNEKKIKGGDLFFKKRGDKDFFFFGWGMTFFVLLKSGAER